MMVIDPARDPQPYYDFAAFNEATITGVIETHPHADFVSSHLEIHQTTGATIYTSKLVGAVYPHEGFDDGDTLQLADTKLKAINTPGHSPDSICILLQDENGYDKALFTGDTLFVGDVGRPDLRENVGNVTAKKEELARDLYHSLREKLTALPHHVTVYPAHGPGSLCGKNMSADLQSTIGREIKENYAMQPMSEAAFIELILADQPLMPAYFGFDVELNKKGAPAYQESIDAVLKLEDKTALEKGITIIDTRPKAEFAKGHTKGAINLQDGDKFETWLGTIIKPGEHFYLIADSDENLDIVIKKTAKIGYEQNIKAALSTAEKGSEHLKKIDLDNFKTSPERYTIVDVRNWTEINQGKIFDHALTIPLPELRERLNEIPKDKPIVVHCAAGYRSAAATSIIAAKIKEAPVYDLSDEITNF
jgi:glyoxylase-like metal-dependent hydrolase (beta-lactamase superfamily II)/rhodanese-related sulfurtransferase